MNRLDKWKETPKHHFVTTWNAYFYQKESKWTKVPEKLIGKIKDNNYIKSHY